MRLIRLLIASAATAAAACGGGGDGDNGGTTGPPTQPPGGSQTLGSVTPSVGSLSLTAGTIATLGFTAYDTENRAIAGATGTFTSGDAGVVEANASGRVIGLYAGSTTLTISVTHGGVTRTAQVPVTVTGTMPSSVVIFASSSDYVFTPKEVVIAAGGAVDFTFGSLEHTVVFANAPGAPASIGTGGYAQTVSRQFGQGGDFVFNCTIHPGMNGVVIVR